MQLANRINLLISPDKAWFGRAFEGARQVMAILLILLGIAVALIQWAGAADQRDGLV